MPESAPTTVSAHLPAPPLMGGYLPKEINAQNSNVASVTRFPRGDIENFSVSRAALAKRKYAEGHSGAWLEIAPWEKQYLDALAEVEFKAQGEMVSGIDGGYLAPEVWSSKFFGLLRNFSTLDQLPITRMAVPARVTHIPKVMGDVTVQTPGENGTITASQYKFGDVSYTARKSAILINLSNEMIRDAGELADQVLRQEGAEAMAIDRDTQLLTGNGSIVPTGLLNSPAVATYYCASTTVINTTPAAASPSYQNVGELIQVVENLNGSTRVTAGQAQCTGMLAHSQFKQTILSSANFQDTSHRPLWLQGLNESGGLFGMDWSLSNVVPVNLTVAANSACSVIVAGHWSRYVLMECETLAFDATVEASGFLSDQTQVRLIHRYDGAPVQPEAFAILAGVLV